MPNARTSVVGEWEGVSPFVGLVYSAARHWLSETEQAMGRMDGGVRGALVFLLACVRWEGA